MNASQTDLSLANLLQPDATVWREATGITLALQGTPAQMQPTAAVRNSWRDRSIGAVGAVEVRALLGDGVLAFHLRWADATANRDHGDNSQFPDAAAIALPLHPDAPLITMGAPGAPLTAWYWRADGGDQGFEVRAQGPGTTQITSRKVHTAADWSDGRWQIVIARTLDGDGGSDSITLSPGGQTRFGVAVWEGSHSERGGLKAYSGDWQALSLGER